MPTLNIHLDISGKDEKLLFGPITEPSPGPTFDIEVAAPEIADTKIDYYIDTLQTEADNCVGDMIQTGNGMKQENKKLA